MAYIVKIKTITKSGMNIGDVVSVQDTDPSKKEYDLFTIESIPDKTAEDLCAEIDIVSPKKLTVWYDDVTREYKEITKEPMFRVKHNNGKFTHNYDDVSISLEGANG